MGHLANGHQPVLDFEPGNEQQHALRGHRGTNVSQVLGVNANGFVGIPTTAGGPQGPTGQVNNANTASFQLTPGTASTSSRFIFANLNGTISGWAGG